MPIPLDELSPETMRTICAAAELLETGITTDAAAHVSDPEIEVTNAGGDGWGKVLREAARGDFILGVTPLQVLYARHLVETTRFHAEIGELFEGMDGVVVSHANMKSMGRSQGKTEDPTKYADLENEAFHLKDILRKSVMAASIPALVAAFEKLAGRHTPVVVKPRITESTHDVLTVIWFRGLLVEVQFHLQDVVALKVSRAFNPHISTPIGMLNAEFCSSLGYLATVGEILTECMFSVCPPHTYERP